MSVASDLPASGFAYATSVAQAQIALTSDIGVTLTATPTSNLVPRQPIDWKMTVTNYGPDRIPVVEASSSMCVNDAVAAGGAVGDGGGVAHGRHQASYVKLV